MYSVSPQVLYQSSQKEDVLLSPTQDISSPFGYSLSAPNDTEMPIEDPVKAIQLISGGKWLILENDGGGIDNDNESLRINAVGNFLDIVSSSVISDEWDCSPQTGGLVLPKTNTKKQTSSSNSNLGGVAVACETQLEIMQLASTLQLKQGENVETITDSGIILQSSAEGSMELATALVLPYAIESWQVATLIFEKDVRIEANESLD